jgi:dTDP-3-amino-3,4,6-trideoxy-alpha-D-glucose transaminase
VRPLPAHTFPAYPDADTRHHRALIDLAIGRVLESGSFILGDEVRCFEASLQQHLHGRHVIAVASGTDALELLLRAISIQPGETVLLPTLAPSAVAAAVARSGAAIQLVDIEPESLTLCPDALRQAIHRTPRARVVLAVHLYGHPARMRELRAICEEHSLILWEDVSQAHGAVLDERVAGSLAEAAAFSFYPTKNLAAIGDAGAIATQDGALAERLRELRQYGWRVRYRSEIVGCNSRMDELQAAVLSAKLPSLSKANARRQQLAAHYHEALAALPQLRLPSIQPGCSHVFHQYVIRTEAREALRHELLRHGVPAAVLYPEPLHLQPAWQQSGPFPIAEQACRELLSLPLHPYLKDEAVQGVTQVIEHFFQS